jgi:hypothetical protein
MGVGRSGTTALYYLLQHILLRNFPNDVDFVYEPFLWDRNACNDDYKNIRYKFRYIDSVSIEGIYNHTKLPLFIGPKNENIENEYVKNLFVPTTPKNHLLLKMIRANGRFRLLNRICPTCKFIFIIRNPIDVINSVSQRFSFYGEDFHPSDFNRFIWELESKFNFTKDKKEIKRIKRDVLYWYYMNYYALESFEESINKPLVICFEDFVDSKKQYVELICRHIGIPFEDDYVNVIKENVSQSYGVPNLTKNEYNLLMPYFSKYEELLSKYQIYNHLNRSKLLKKFKNKLLDTKPADNSFGMTTISLRKRYESYLQSKKKKKKFRPIKRIKKFYKNYKLKFFY